MSVSRGDTLIDGVAGDRVSSADRGLHYGDGLFETVTCVGGRPRWLARHLERLGSGCRRLRLTEPDAGTLQGEIEQLARGQARCIVKVIFTRGVAVQRGYRPAGTERPTRLVSRHAWPETPGSARGLRVALSRVWLGCNPALAGLKHLNRLEQVLAQIERPDGVDEVLMCAGDGAIVSGSMSNAFFANENGLVTPELQQAGVAGIMRALVLEAAMKLGMSVTVRPVRVAELGGFQEAFVTNVRWGVRSIDELEGRLVPHDARARALRDLIDEMGA